MVWYLLALPLLPVLGYGLYRRSKSVQIWRHEFQVARAREAFALQKERLEGLFLKAAVATGKPRGLRWLRCTFETDVVLARERQTNQLVGLVPVTVEFEAVEGGDMEGVAAVANLRNASAVLVFFKGQWQTSGKAVFNLNPPEVLERFKDEYEAVGPGRGR